MDAVQEVKARLNIEDVISQYVQLKRSGRNFKGLSPWTNEKTPSFMVSPEKQIWHDFSSGKGGDMFGFVMEMEGLDFKATLELLARQAGVDLEQFRGKSRSDGAQLKSRALEALELATKFYQKQLTVNQAALKYLLRERQFSKQTLLTWQLGYAPNTSFALTDFLTKQGFTTDEMKRAGLSTMRRGRPSDMFHGRIMIPLADSRGTVIGFTARLLEDTRDAPKYINTPQTMVYDKSRQVFGLHLAKEAIRKDNFVVVAEGNLDVISSHQAGVGNVVASAGTAMTERHLRELKRFTGDIRLCFDADQAGITATERVIPLAQKAGVSLSIVSIKGAKDPDELVRKDVEAWRQAITKADDAPNWLIDKYQAQLDLTSAPGKRAFTDTLLATIRQLTDAVEQEHYLKKIAALTNTSLEAVQSKLASGKSPTVPRRAAKISPQQLDKSVLEYQKLQDHFLAITLMKPELHDLLEDCQATYFTEGPPRTVFDFLMKHPGSKDHSELTKGLPAVSDYVKIVSLQFEELYDDLPLDDLRDQAVNLKRRLVERYAKNQKQRLMGAMQATTSEQEMARLIGQVDVLNQLIKPSAAEDK